LADAKIELAREQADKALKLAKRVLDQIDALIALGCAHLESGEREGLVEAKHNFERALDLNKTAHAGKADPTTTTATCYLRLALTCAQLGDTEEANRHLRQWKAIEAQVEDEGLHRLAKEASRAVASVGGFVIARDDDWLDYHSRSQELRRFLHKRAADQRHAKLSDQLGLTDPGLKGWEKTFRLESQLEGKFKELCKQLPRGNEGVIRFENLIEEYGAYSTARRVLLGKEDGIYNTVFQLAKEQGLLRLTVEEIVKNESSTEGLFMKGEQKLAERRLQRFGVS
jgi:hypothetical protein